MTKEEYDLTIKGNGRPIPMAAMQIIKDQVEIIQEKLPEFKILITNFYVDGSL